MFRSTELAAWMALCSLPSWTHCAPHRSHRPLPSGAMTITIRKDLQTGHRCISTSLGLRFVWSEGGTVNSAVCRSLVANHRHVPVRRQLTPNGQFPRGPSPSGSGPARAGCGPCSASRTGCSPHPGTWPRCRPASIPFGIDENGPPLGHPARGPYGRRAKHPRARIPARTAPSLANARVDGRVFMISRVGYSGVRSGRPSGGRRGGGPGRRGPRPLHRPSPAPAERGDGPRNREASAMDRRLRWATRSSW